MVPVWETFLNDELLHFLKQLLAFLLIELDDLLAVEEEDQAPLLPLHVSQLDPFQDGFDFFLRKRVVKSRIQSTPKDVALRNLVEVE